MIEVHVGTLSVMQSGYRLAPDAMKLLIAHVEAGGIFAGRSPHDRATEHAGLIALTRFEDGRLAIRDGLHRATAILVGRPSQLMYPEEYFIEEMTYDMFRSPNLKAGFVTPFDPRTEVRNADCSDFRTEVRRLIAAGSDPLPYIANNKRSYTSPRHPYHDTLAEFHRRMSAT